MTFSILLTPHQKLAADAVASWWQKHLDDSPDKRSYFYLAGYAGTGKTSIAKYLVDQLAPPKRESTETGEDPGEDTPPLRFTFAAFTGKASLMLSRKDCKPSSTIHSLIYQRVFDETTKEFYFEKREQLRATFDLLVLDECSMINFEMGDDLLSFNVPILVLGDPGQLPPVDGAGFFTSNKPDFFLEEIHRQALESPILSLATRARKGETLIPSTKTNNGSTVTITTTNPILKTLCSVDQVLCGTNRTRTKINTLIRQAYQYNSFLPVIGDKLICLKNNWDLPGMCNGSLWQVRSVEELEKPFPDRLRLQLTDWDNPDSTKITVTTHKCFFTDAPPPVKSAWNGLTQFTFGYCITVHKAQGSEWDSIFIYNESQAFREHSAKWLYTAITRAAKNLIIL